MARWLPRLRRKPQAAEQYGFLGWNTGGGSGWFSTVANLPPWPGTLATTTPVVTVSSAIGLPAVAAAVRVLSETLGTVPLLVYQGDPPEREKARDSWQWHRLHDQPNDEQSAFDFVQDIETCIETVGNAYVWKAKARPIIRDEEDIQLFVIDPFRVRVTRENGQKVFKIWNKGAEETYDASSVLHIRGWTPWPGMDQAPSPIQLHREGIVASLARELYESGFFSNNAQTSLAIVAPERVPDDVAKEIVDRFVAQHTGANAWRPVFVSGGADIKPLALTQRDAQYIEQRQFAIEETARMFHITAVGMLRQAVMGTQSSTAEDFERFLKVDLAPRMRRIELAFKSDRDLFPRNDDLMPEFLADAVLRPDVKTRYDAYRVARQAGWLSANEIREKENLASAAGGDEIQATPVGGAPNP